MPVDRCGGLAGPTGRFYRNPAKTRQFTDSCSEPILGTVRCCEGEDFKSNKSAVGKIQSREEQEGKDMMEPGQNAATLQ
jgi:hypothetical protein